MSKKKSTTKPSRRAIKLGKVSRRAARYESLRPFFTDFEARTFSRLNQADIPYFQDMIAQRKKLYEGFRRTRRGMNFRQLDITYRAMIIDMYKSRGWWKGAGQYESSAWEYFRESTKGEHAFKKYHKDWKSPWIPRQKELRNQIKGIELGLKSR